jgi:hypothetical protein
MSGSGFTPEAFASKLSKLSDSQASIQTLSHWVQYHKKACVESAAAWAAETLRVPPNRQLVLVYLANDILQNSRRKGPEFVKSYGPQMVTVLPKVYAAASSSVQAKLQRLLGIWEERHVLPTNTLTDIRMRMGTGAAANTSEGSSSSGAKRPREEAEVETDDDDEYVPMAPSPSASERGSFGGGGGASGGGQSGGGSGSGASSVTLADLLVTLDEGSLTDELQAEREADLDMAALEDMEIGDPSELGPAKTKAAAALKLLTEQQAKIKEELLARRQFIMLLASSVERQHEQCNKLSAALKSCESMLSTAQQAAEQVQAMEEQMASIAAAAAEAM